MDYENVTYSRDALDGVIADLCKTLGLDRRMVNKITIMDGQIVAEVKVATSFTGRVPDGNTVPHGIELKGFQYDPPR